MTNHEKYMRRALYLANLGKGHVAPNPLVGSVITLNGKIIGEGYHQKYGESHAEVNAINNVADETLLSQATMYVTLEPCAHYGRTPPCAELIIQKKIPKVIIGCKDSYDEVDGKGISMLKEAGVEVTTGVLERECQDLNKRFFIFHEKKRPYVILKWAQDQLGNIDIIRTNGEKGNHWITASETQVLTHKWRHEEAAILVGNNTVSNDNPSLTCRAFSGENPVRIVIDKNLKLDYGAFKIGDRSVLTYILTKKTVMGSGNLQFVEPKDFSIQGILTTLHELNIQSVIIEGGLTTLEKFIEAKIWDEVRILEGNNNCSPGVKAPRIDGRVNAAYNYGVDRIKIIENA